MIVVTAPTGAIGSQVLPHLLDGDEPLRVVVRDPTKLGDRVRDRAEVVVGSHGDPDVVDRAFTGADTVLWVIPPRPGAPGPEASFVDFTRPAAEAARRRGVARVVGISALGRGTPQAAHAGHVTATLAADDLFTAACAAGGAAYRALVLPSFMDNLLRQVRSIGTDGTFHGPLPGDLRAPSIAVRDIAAVAAGLLRDPSWTGTGEVAALGPEDLSADDQAAVLSEVLGRPIRYRRIPFADFGANLQRFGHSPGMAQAMVDMSRAKADGLDNAEPRTPRASTPTTFRQWATEVLVPALDGRSAPVAH